MGEPTTVNPVADTINHILKGAIEDVAEPAAEAAIIANVPWLGLPVVKTILEWALGWLGGYIYRESAIAATKIIIDLQTNLEKSACYGAFQNLQMALASGDQNAIKIASDDLDKAYGNLIHYDGSANP